MNRKFTILVMITTMLLLIFVTVGLAKPVIQYNDKYDIGPYSIDNPCTGETFEYTGTVHISGQSFTDSSGGFHSKAHVNIHVVGIAPDGTEYIGSQIENYQFNSKLLHCEDTEIFKISMISKGKEANLILQMRFHITINANGEVTANFDEVKNICTGEKP